MSTIEYQIVAVYRPDGAQQDSTVISVVTGPDEMRAEVSRLRTRYGALPAFTLDIDKIEREGVTIIRRQSMGPPRRPVPNPTWGR